MMCINNKSLENEVSRVISSSEKILTYKKVREFSRQRKIALITHYTSFYIGMDIISLYALIAVSRTATTVSSAISALDTAKTTS